MVRRTHLSALALLLFAGDAYSFSITDVAVLPAEPITTNDPVQLIVEVMTPNQDAFLYSPSVVAINGRDIVADIFISDGMILPATDSLEETLTLGMLSAGVYSYLVRITPGYNVNFGVREVTGSFTVIPLPMPLVLLLSGLATIAGVRRAAPR